MSQENHIQGTDENTDTQQVHKRRVRYKGTHPKGFGEKYKELAPEKYAQDVAKVIARGATPAGMHISICVREILDFLHIEPGQTGLDATLGYGGHTCEMLKCITGGGHLYALDADPIEISKASARIAALGYGEDVFTAINLNFADIDKVAQRTGKYDFVLADLGVSSMQIDNPERGFSYKVEGPLDLRLNPLKGYSAAEVLKTITQAQLQGMLTENADEPYAELISKAVIAHIRRGDDIATTTKLRDIIEEALGFIPFVERKDAVKKSCQRTFQALRIDVNNEFEVLYAFLEKLPQVLAPNGRVAILSFHSGEDRLVKKSFKRLLSEGEYKAISTELIRPTAEECYANPRASSAKLRWAIKA